MVLGDARLEGGFSGEFEGGRFGEGLRFPGSEPRAWAACSGSACLPRALA